MAKGEKKKKTINVIYLHSNPPPMKSPPPKTLQHANPMNCDTPVLGKAGWREESRGRCGEKTGVPRLRFPQEDGWRGGSHGGGRGGESWKNQTEPSPRSPESVCVCVCKSVCKCVCRCADLALLSEGCIRVACRKGHRTTVVLQKKKRKKRAAEPSGSEFSHPGRKDSRKGGGGKQG